MNTHKRESPCLVPHEFSSRAQMLKRGHATARLPERVSLPGAALYFGVRWLDAAFDFASALAFQTVAVAGMERKKPNQSGVEPPHSKEAYRPMDHGKARPSNSGRSESPQKDLGRNACRWQNAR